MCAVSVSDKAGLIAAKLRLWLFVKAGAKVDRIWYNDKFCVSMVYCFFPWATERRNCSMLLGLVCGCCTHWQCVKW